MTKLHSARLLCLKACLSLVIGFGVPLQVQAAEAKQLNIALMISSGMQRSAYDGIIRRFANRHPDIKIAKTVRAAEEYKEQLPGWLTLESGPADVYFTFAGAKLENFVNQGLIASIDATPWQSQMKPGLVNAVKIRGQVYGLPLSVYQWGFYYHKSTFTELGITPPATWSDFLAVCDTLKAHNITPIALGSKVRWVLAGWFDYLNLRLNGIAFHKELMHGIASYKDPRVAEVFGYWRQLIDRGYFSINHPQHDWQFALPSVYRRKAGMILLGNFVLPAVPAPIMPELGFFRFPTILPNMPLFEDVPLDVVVIAAKSRHQREAKLFVDYMADPEVQAEINEVTAMIPANKLSRDAQNPLAAAGAKLVAEAKDFAHYFDRDTVAAMSAPALDQFAAFMDDPRKLPAVLTELEKVRQRVFVKTPE
ncbi:MAG: extracellular solute-binding protein [Deltaproteobacteria bacterium]|nr:extracellular solute-binding protein [Deltaproteobacteria bacterium]